MIIIILQMENWKRERISNLSKVNDRLLEKSHIKETGKVMAVMMEIMGQS